MKRLLYITIMLLCFTSCHHQKGESEKQIMVTIEPLRFFVEQIAGKNYEVKSLVPYASSPETYEPTPQQMVTLSDCEAFISIGSLQNEKMWAERIESNVPNIALFTVGDSISYIRESNGEFDPHVWTSPRNARLIANNVCNVLCTMDSLNSDYYKANLAKLIERIDKTDNMVHSILDGSIHRTFVIYHPALSYFAQEYGLIQIAIEEDGKEPTPDLLRNIILRSHDEKVKVIFVQKEFNKRNAEIIAKETKARIETINPLNYNWDKEMVEIAKKLK